MNRFQVFMFEWFGLYKETNRRAWRKWDAEFAKRCPPPPKSSREVDPQMDSFRGVFRKP